MIVGVLFSGHDKFQDTSLKGIRKKVTKSILKDLGKLAKEPKEIKNKRRFSTGAVRDVDNNKEDYVESVSWLAMKRFALYMKSKEGRYGPGNWKKGIPIIEYEKSLIRHLQKYLANKYDGGKDEPNEDHLAAMRFNLDGIMHEEEKLKNGTK